MFDIGWSEMLVIAIVVIVVVGPKELPGMLRTFGKTTAKLRVMANDFRKQFDEAMKEAELDDLKQLANDARSLNPASQIKKALSPMEQAARDVKAGLDSAMKPETSAVTDASADAAQADESGDTPAAAAMKAAVAKATAATAATAAANSAAATTASSPEALASDALPPENTQSVAAGEQADAGGAKS
ncbi:Sec-independent protein translocase protein TatB [Aquamicrobium zhengzhouense]|uniref:Sec-independent protein translocase protein TatB n=1 Tax=Aquamicrobium zhengzhouense TaxID=2781738 RepID=A0ABS0SAZ6_9HYPH|nr:Sec-independent protein translocase protein TatB [Aquamicrobium zhengzhouense]MBI1620464.1 twin-arginine translocase subunit TatB [Aquamicrobium zhengzhouense]